MRLKGPVATPLALLGAALCANCAPASGLRQPLAAQVPGVWVLPATLATIEPYDAVALPMRGSYDSHDAAISRVASLLRTAGVPPSGPAFGRYFNDPSQVRQEDVRWEVGFPVDAPLVVAPPFELRHFSRELVARTVVEGPYSEGGRRWPALHAWVAANGLGMSGFPMAIWSGDPAQGGANGPRTELRIPVARLNIPLRLMRDLLCLFGSAVFALFTLLYLRERRARASLWGGAVWGWLGVCCACVYLQPLLQDLLYLYMGSGAWLASVELGSVAIGFVAPPLLVHLFYFRGRARLPWRRSWLACVVLVYLADLLLMALVALRPVAIGRVAPTDRVAAAFVASAALVALAMEWVGQRAATGPSHGGEHRTYCVVLAAIALAATADAVPLGGELSRAVASLVLLGAPIVLLFVTAYHNERATFFDVLAKTGSFLLVALVLLGLYFRFVPGLLFSIRQGWLGLWLYPASALPLVLAAPWGYKKLTAVIDRLWLGRRLSPAEAGESFLAALRGAASRDTLLRTAEERLSEILQAPTRITLDGGPRSADADPGWRALVREGGRVAGTIRVDTRAGGRRLLSEDRALLDTLAEGFSVMLDNVRLHESRLEQETKERELLLLASHSELRALRAQINPHFLFNALNTIAALARRDPLRAEETVERLAEVFRYTLRGSELEWVRVSDELAFVRAYLELELTRFGERLAVATEVDDEAARAFVPSMIVQTLVENAVKHGVATCRGRGRVEVEARRRDGQLWIEVRDSGPGFPPTASDASTDQGSSGSLPASPRGTGHGLRNVRERLRGHFGATGTIVIVRDGEPAMTRVRVSLPFLSDAPGEGRARA